MRNTTVHQVPIFDVADLSITAGSKEKNSTVERKIML